MHACVCVCVSVCQVIVHEVPGQELEVEVFDKDPDHDDFLGRYHITAFFSVYPSLIYSLKGVMSYFDPILPHSWYDLFCIDLFQIFHFLNINS